MIFRAELAKVILQGRKTMTRRPVKAGEKACRYRENHAYSIQPGRGKRGIGKLTVTEVHRERLGDLTIKDAKREGFRSVQEFIDYWTALYGKWNPEIEVWVISFFKGDHTDQDRYLAAAPAGQFCNARLSNGKRCGRAFLDGHDTCKCGARRPDEKLDDHGYTTLPHKGLKGEKAAIPAPLQERYSKEGRERDKARKRRELTGRGKLAPAERLRAAEEDARRRGIDISGETRLIAQRARRAERQLPS